MMMNQRKTCQRLISAIMDWLSKFYKNKNAKLSDNLALKTFG